MSDRRVARRGAVVAGLLALSAATVPGCSDEPPRTFPITPASPSRHDALHDTLVLDVRTTSFEAGDWLEDLGDAPFFGPAVLARRDQVGALDAEEEARLAASLARARALLAEDLLTGDLQEKVMASLGFIEHVAASGDTSDLAVLDDFIDRLGAMMSLLGDYADGAADRSWAVRTYGPTAVTALVALVSAQYALEIPGPRASERKEHALKLDGVIVDRALTELADTVTSRTVRGYARGPGDPSLDLVPNVAMMMLKARLFRLTGDETHRLAARALYGAIQPLKLSDAPARYASPYAAAGLGVGPHDVATLSSQNYLALALLLLFEVTGDARFVDEADRVFDALEEMRGPWCLAQVHGTGCARVACEPGQACVGESCTADRCQEGLLHHVVNGRLAVPADGTFYCSGCNWQTLYVIGYRRSLGGGTF